MCGWARKFSSRRNATTIVLVDWVRYVGLSTHSVVVLQQRQNQVDGLLGMESLEVCLGDLGGLAINPECH